MEINDLSISDRLHSAKRFYVLRMKIRELEILLLDIFRHDPRIKLMNMQTGSKQLS